MQGYMKIYTRRYYQLHQTRYFISFMYDRFYDLYYITRLNVRLVNCLRIFPPFIRWAPSTVAFHHANKLFPPGKFINFISHIGAAT